MKKVLILLIFLLASCTLNKVVQHHGVHNLEIKQTKLKINETNKNDIIELIGPPSTKSTFDNDLYIYVERKTSGSKLRKLGKKILIKNDVLVLEIDSKGILIAKNFYNKNDMNNLVFDKDETDVNYSKRSFIYNFLTSLRQKIDDPLGKKRIKN
tara:strand:+ start:511 stop:972 length:462 start_codon:yes stop_codon:yes gene_type:complete